MFELISNSLMISRQNYIKVNERINCIEYISIKSKNWIKQTTFENEVSFKKKPFMNLNDSNR